jgi:hypothetical protein
MKVLGVERSKLWGVLGKWMPARPALFENPVRVVNIMRGSELACLVEVADRGARRRKGLLGRDGLAPGEGLWIVPCEAVHTFGMRFAIDLVYLNRAKRIVKIRHCVPPGRISGCLTAHSVLELRAGSVAASQAAVGDQLAFEPAIPSSGP